MGWQVWATVAIIVAAVIAFASEKNPHRPGRAAGAGAAGRAADRRPRRCPERLRQRGHDHRGRDVRAEPGHRAPGALEPLSRWLSRIRKPWLLTLAMMLTIAPMGAFVKNIALVATFLPLALRACALSGTSPGGC